MYTGERKSGGVPSGLFLIFRQFLDNTLMIGSVHFVNLGENINHIKNSVHQISVNKW